MPQESQLSHRNVKNTNIPYVSFLSPNATDPCFIPGSQDLLTSLQGFAERRPGFADTVEPTPTVFNNLQRLFTWDRFDGVFIEMACDINSGGFAQVYKRVIGTDVSFISIFTDTSATPFDFVTSNNTVYFSNGHAAKKWDPVNGLSNWGIAIGSVNNATGPNTAGSGVNQGNGSPVWTNPNNVTSAVGFATVALTGPGTGVALSDNLLAETFGFAIASTSTITGIQVTFEAGNSAPVGVTPNIWANLIKGGVIVGAIPFHTTTVTASTVTYTMGGTSDLWGTTWTPTEINQGNFGVSLTAALGNSGNTSTFRVRNVQITIYGIGGPTVVVNAAAGTFSATIGYQYVFAYGNSKTGHVSGPTPASASTGPFVNRLNVSIGLTASTDPQVDQIWLFRSTDSVAPGTTAQNYFALPTSPYPNTTQTVTDNAPDISLIFSSIAPFPTFNAPPIPFQQPTYFVGRIFGFKNNQVFFSELEECIIGVPEESFITGVAGNFWNFDEPVQSLAVSGNSSLVVFCGGRVYAISGNTLDTFRRDKVTDRMGSRSLTSTATLGGGIAWLDSSNQIWMSDGSTATELSEPIRPDIAGVNPALCSATFHKRGTQHWLVFSTGTKLFVYDVDTSQWMPPWSFAAQYVYSGEVAPGDYRLMAATATKAVQLTITGANNDRGVAYQPIARLAHMAMVPDFGSRFSAAGLSTYDEPSKTGWPAYFQIDTNSAGLSNVAFLIDEDPINFSPVYTSLTVANTTSPQVAWNRQQGVNYVQRVYALVQPTGRFISWQIKGNTADDALRLYSWFMAYKQSK